MVIQAIVPSTSITTGALQVAGGAGIVGNVYTGGNVVINAIAPSTNTTTGALQVLGGAGIGGNVYTGGNVVINAIVPSTSTTTGALQVAGGAGIGGNVFTGGIVDILSTESSISTTTGALQVLGGAGIVGNVYTGGNVVIQAVVPSTSTTTGALRVAGGAGIQGSIFIGGSLITGEDISCNGNVLFSNNLILNTSDVSNVTAYTTPTLQSVGSNNMRWLAMSSNGQHIAVINTPATPFFVFVSNDFGTTFVNRASIAYTSASGSVAVSPSGKNMVAMAYAAGTSQAYNFSTNFGISWSTISISTGSFTPTTTQPSLYVNDSGIIYFSNTTFAYSIPSLGSTSVTTFSNNSNGQSIAASYDGRYILSTHLTTAAWVSSNNGSSFATTGQNGTNAAVSGNGRYMVLLNGTNIVVSNNFGVSGSWTTVSSPTVGSPVTYFTISYNGQNMIAASGNNTSIYYSVNYGVSWTGIGSVGNILNIVLSGDGTRYAASYSATTNNVGISTAFSNLIYNTSRVKQKQITGFMDVSCGMIQPSYIITTNPLAPTDDMYGSFIQIQGSVNIYQVLPTPVTSSRRGATITIWNNSSANQTILTSQGQIVGFTPITSGSIELLPFDRVNLRSDGYNWVNVASAYAPKLSYISVPTPSPYDVGYLYFSTQTVITTATINTNQQLSTITNVVTGIYIANVVHSMTVTASSTTIAAGFSSLTSVNNMHERGFNITATASTFPLNLNAVILVQGPSTIYFNFRHTAASTSTSVNGNHSLFTLTRIG